GSGRCFDLQRSREMPMGSKRVSSGSAQAPRTAGSRRSIPIRPARYGYRPRSYSAVPPSARRNAVQ
ncbi:hypothetical protein K438DRAFT_1883721, partial [Mycena galopus ATCC 62051]